MEGRSREAAEDDAVAALAKTQLLATTESSSVLRLPSRAHGEAPARGERPDVPDCGLLPVLSARFGRFLRLLSCFVCRHFLGPYFLGSQLSEACFCAVNIVARDREHIAAASRTGRAAIGDAECVVKTGSLEVPCGLLNSGQAAF